jgi:alkenylglycerophosphocholine/alkenylglycerophosphoethanolamine hydrolase
MTTAAGLLLGLTALFALGDWYAVATKRRTLEVVCKPLTLVALIGVAVLLDPSDPSVRTWFVAGLVFSLAGDIFLLWADRLFVAGLASFLIGHICYIIGFFVGGVTPLGIAFGLVAVAVAMAALGRRILSAVKNGDEPELLAPVVAYIGVISVMVVAAFGSANPLAIGGSLSFYASDALIAWNRFVEEYPWGRIAVIVTYHAAQVALVLSLL